MGRAFGRVFLVCFFLIGLLSPAEARRVALVIGNSAYAHASPLANPKNDADALAAVLKRLDFEVVKGIDLKRLEFERTVREFSRAIRGADVALLFYAGHGLQVNGRNYLAPVDAKLADEADLDFETLPIRTILKQMEREVKTSLVFLDACRDNPLARNMARSMGTRSGSVGRGLARVDSGIGTLIAFATEPGNVALDGDGKNSPFTSALVKHIETPGLDIAQMMRRVRSDVMRSTAKRQVPWNNSSLTGDFYFAGKVTVNSGNTKPKDDKRITELQSKLKKLEQQLMSKPAPEQQRKDGQKLSALQMELAELREEMKKRPAAKPEPRDDKKMEAMQQELAELKKRLEEKDQPKKAASKEETKVAVGIHSEQKEKKSDNQATPPVHECDHLAAQEGNPDNPGPFIHYPSIDPDKAVPACRQALRAFPGVARFQFQLARALQVGGNLAEAEKLYRVLAEAEYPPGLNGLAVLHMEGLGMPKNPARAAELFQKAADLGNIFALSNLGAVYLLGNGVVKDMEKALQMQSAAAKKSLSLAYARLGTMYFQGSGVAKNEVEALKWYRKAANKEFPPAMNNIGVLYLRGAGVTRDDAEAVKWYRKAAEKGWHPAMYNLAEMYDVGQGIAQDYAEAAKWYDKAASFGHSKAITKLGKLYWIGNGIREDSAEAERLWRKAAKLNDSDARELISALDDPEDANRLGYQDERQSNYASAAKWYEFAADRAHPTAAYNLAVLLDLAPAGVEQDPSKAAGYALKALRRGDQTAVDQLTRKPGFRSEKFRRELQKLLKQDGVYNGPIDGDFGLATKRAIETLAKK